MAKPFSALPSILDNRRKEFLSGVNQLSRDAAAVAGETAVLSTKVDTGLARSNWRGTVAVPAATVVPPYAPGSRLGIGERGNAIGAFTQQRIALRGWNAVRGVPFFITNNVPYIAAINFGFGIHAGSPGNMLAMARQAWVTYLKTPRRILR